ncbi:MAG: ribosome-associated translation inhibitor RaiA, partial [Ruthenibacterium sp.]
MKITCTGRKVSLKDAFVTRVETKIKKLDKYFSDGAEAQVTVTVEKDWQTVEITVKDRGFTSRAEKDAERMEDAFDAALDLLERRILKNRRRLEDRMQHP